MPPQAFDVDNKHGKNALFRVYSDVLGETDGAMPGVQVSLSVCLYP
jgi:hypothetical protein